MLCYTQGPYTISINIWYIIHSRYIASSLCFTWCIEDKHENNYLTILSMKQQKTSSFIVKLGHLFTMICYGLLATGQRKRFWRLFVWRVTCVSLLEAQCNLDCLNLPILPMVWNRPKKSDLLYSLQPVICPPLTLLMRTRPLLCFNFMSEFCENKEITDVKCHTEEILKNISILYEDIDHFKNSHNRQSVADQGMNLHRIR